MEQKRLKQLALTNLGRRERNWCAKHELHFPPGKVGTSWFMSCAVLMRGQGKIFWKGETPDAVPSYATIQPIAEMPGTGVLKITDLAAWLKDEAAHIDQELVRDMVLAAATEFEAGDVEAAHRFLVKASE